MCEVHARNNLKEDLLALPTLDLKQPIKSLLSKSMGMKSIRLTPQTKSLGLFLICLSIVEVHYAAAPSERSAVDRAGPAAVLIRSPAVI